MNSYSYAFSHTKRFNDLILNDRTLRDKFVLGEYNFLQIYQVLIFNDFKFLYDEKKSPDSYSLSRGGINFKATLKRLVSVLVSAWGYAFLILSRRRILVYASDKINDLKYRCDFRMANLYKQLFLKNIKFIEILHTAYDENFYDYVIKRRRPALYLESADLFYKIFSKFNFKKSKEPVNTADFSSFGEEAEFAELLLKKYLAMIDKTRFRINCISKLLRLSGIKTLICVPDTRNYHELVQACSLNKIKTYAFGSGALSKYDVGLLDSSSRKGNIIKPDTLFLSSQYWIEELLRLGSIFDRNELVIGGDIKEDRLAANDTGAMTIREKEREITVLVSYETGAIKSAVREYIQKMLKCPDTRVIFSIRPGRDVGAQFAEYGIENMPENFSAMNNLSKAINDADFIAGTQSTLMYDMISYRKPVLILKTDMDMLEGMAQNGLADTLDINDADFCQRLRKAKETSFEVLTQRKKRLYEGAVSLDKTLSEILKK